MGEAKNRARFVGSSAEPGIVGSAATVLAKQLIDHGLLIEACFASFRGMAMAFDAPVEQVREMRLAFIAGAQHLFGTIMDTLDPEAEPTADDEARMGKIAAELQSFVDEFKLRVGPTSGQA